MEKCDKGPKFREGGVSHSLGLDGDKQTGRVGVQGQLGRVVDLLRPVPSVSDTQLVRGPESSGS